jgi:hypothetical protein
VIPTALLLAVGCAADRPSPSDRLVGAWRSSIQFESGALAAVKGFEFLYVFNQGGTMTESSNYDSAPPVPPAYGVWRAVGPNAFEARYDFFTTTPASADAFKAGAGWVPSGRGVLTERIQLSDDGHAFTSTIRYEPLNAKGEPAPGAGQGKGRAVRLVVGP